jgi:glycine betaine/proline transport system substrate-binding protein
MRIKMFAATAAIALSFGATSASADCGEVSITEMEWQVEKAQNQCAVLL